MKKLLMFSMLAVAPAVFGLGRQMPINNLPNVKGWGCQYEPNQAQCCEYYAYNYIDGKIPKSIGQDSSGAIEYGVRQNYIKGTSDYQYLYNLCNNLKSQ